APQERAWPARRPPEGTTVRASPPLRGPEVLPGRRVERTVRPLTERRSGLGTADDADGAGGQVPLLGQPPVERHREHPHAERHDDAHDAGDELVDAETVEHRKARRAENRGDRVERPDL